MPSKIVQIDKTMQGWGEVKKSCLHPEHNPPAHIVIPFGHKLIHTCPHCGESVTINSSERYCW